MAQDTGPRLFLGRPCYFAAVEETKSTSICTPLLWTHQRYSPQIIASMVAALRRFLALHPFRRVVLIGYSGGGTLAWLMAAQVPETAEIVTVAANLDTDDWTHIHDYSPLAGSLNPALMPPLSPTIGQFHYVGGRDRNVPPSVVQSFARRHPGAQVIELADFDHECCWIERWPKLLEEVERARLGARAKTAPRPRFRHRRINVLGTPAREKPPAGRILLPTSCRAPSIFGSISFVASGI
jgi:pimeloyl-ACP methyl ester carboxylesterase